MRGVDPLAGGEQARDFESLDEEDLLVFGA
jgi:hypothetical protein